MQINNRLRYFRMSMRYNKVRPVEFGLQVSTSDPRLYIAPEDGSRWEKRRLYDFGWGPEVGFVRLPKLEFEDLWELLLNSGVEENRYGAAAIILMDYPDLLLEQVESAMRQGDIGQQFRSALDILELDKAINWTDPTEKTPEDVREDYRRWSEVAAWTKGLSPST